MLRYIGFGSLAGKFIFITGFVLLLMFTGLYIYQYNEVAKPIEKQFMDEGKALAVSLANAIQSVTENDLANGVTLSDGGFISGDKLKTMLFDDKLTLVSESEEAARKRNEDPDYGNAKQTLFDGSQIPVWEYELKYMSAFDPYTDERWQGLIDSYLIRNSVVFALPTFYSENPKAAGYISTHNTVYSPTGEASTDQWGSKDLISQKYRANRVFNDKTGYQAAAYKNKDEPLVQVYPRLIEGRTVTMWDIAYPLYFQDKHWGGVRVAMSKQKADDMISAQRRSMLYQYLILFFVIMVLLYVLTRVLVKNRIQLLTSNANRIFSSGKLDLTHQFDIGGNDEISQLSRVLNSMTASLRELVESVQKMADDVSSSSKGLSQNVVQTSTAATQLHTSMMEVSEGAGKQAFGAAGGAVAAEEMSAGLQRIAEACSSIYASSQDAVKQIERGERQTTTLTGQMNQLFSSTESTADLIRKLNDLSQEIGSIATVITGISNQTNILALNASIEASRTGEYGRGFMVIADEIRKLSTQTRESSNKIIDVINEVQSYTGAAVSSMDANANEVRNCVEAVEHLSLALNQILKATQLVDSDIQEVSATSEQMIASTEEVAASVEEIAGIAKHSADHIRSAVEDYKEQITVIAQISESAELLANLACELQQGLQRFKV
jgi:methyl-accepting chemotaxis protein